MVARSAAALAMVRLYTVFCSSPTAPSLAALAAPLSFWRGLVREMPTQIATAAISGILLVVAGRLALESWSSLAGWTLHAAQWVLSLYETDVVLDVGRGILGAGDFMSASTKECSGYEGIGLVTGVPGVLLLADATPVAFSAGAAAHRDRHRSVLDVKRAAYCPTDKRRPARFPKMALNGFPFAGGMNSFLGIAIGLMAVSIWCPYFRAEPGRSASPRTGR